MNEKLSPLARSLESGKWKVDPWKVREETITIEMQPIRKPLVLSHDEPAIVFRRTSEDLGSDYILSQEDSRITITPTSTRNLHLYCEIGNEIFSNTVDITSSDQWELTDGTILTNMMKFDHREGNWFGMLRMYPTYTEIRLIIYDKGIKVNDVFDKIGLDCLKEKGVVLGCDVYRQIFKPHLKDGIHFREYFNALAEINPPTKLKQREIQKNERQNQGGIVKGNFDKKNQ